MSIFKACDVRGVYGEELTEELALRLGRAVGTVLRQRSPEPHPRILVGGDVRTSTPALQAALVEGLRQTGLAVLDLGTVPTPVFYFARIHLATKAGVMVTASHNPPAFNGFKIVLDELPITPEELQHLRDLTYRGDFLTGRGTVERRDVVGEYVGFLRRLAAPVPAASPPFRLVVDCGHGCYSSIAPAVCRDLGYEVEELFCQPDGTFPGRPPNSAVAENLAALCARVPAVSADLGVAFDGDGDRVSFVDERGRAVPSDAAAVLLARCELAQAPGGKVVHDIKCSQLLREAIQAAGGIPLMEKSGHTFIKARMITEQAIFGAEISGHFFYARLQGGDDGLYSALRMAEVLRASGRSLGSLVDELPTFHTTPDLRVPWDGGGQVLESIAAAFPPERVSRLDGVRVQFDDGWGLARLSVTEPAITLRFEARTAERLPELIREFLQPVPELAFRLTLRDALPLRPTG